MPGNTWKGVWETSRRDEGGMDPAGAKRKQCPDESILFAYTRGQKLDNLQEIHQHINSCLYCRHKCLRYNQLNTSLDSLKQGPQTQYYPEQLVELVFEKIQAHEAQRHTLAGRVFQAIQGTLENIQAHVEGPILGTVLDICERARPAPGDINSTTRSFRRARLSVVVVTLILTILMVTFVVMAMSHSSSGSFLDPFVSGTRLSSSNQPGLVAHATPTPTSSLQGTSTGGASQLPTAITGPAQKGPFLTECTTPVQRTRHLLVICGSNFKPKHKVALFFDMHGSGDLRQRGTDVIDAQGNFRFAFSTSICRNIPVAVYVKDVATNPTNTPKNYLAMLQITQPDNCSAPPQSPGGLQGGQPQVGGTPLGESSRP